MRGLKVGATVREEQVRSAYATMSLAEADARASRLLRQARGRIERGNLVALITACRTAAERDRGRTEPVAAHYSTNVGSGSSSMGSSSSPQWSNSRRWRRRSGTRPKMQLSGSVSRAITSSG